MRILQTLREKFVISIFLLATLFLLAGEGYLEDAFTLNQQAIILNHHLATSPSSSIGLPTRVVSPPSIIASWYQLFAGRYEQAGKIWQNPNIRLDTFLSRLIDNGEFDLARNWWLTGLEEQDEKHAFLGQQICRLDYEEKFCDEYVWESHSNLLSNADFNQGKAGWNLSAGNDAFEVTACREENISCAYLDKKLSSTGNSSWSQCFDPPDKIQQVVFSAYIRAEVLDGSAWRPVYVQGLIEGEINGVWLETKQGKSKWQSYKQTIDLTQFDSDESICFYPVVLENVGQVWFYGASVRSISAGDGDQE